MAGFTGVSLQALNDDRHRDIVLSMKNSYPIAVIARFATLKSLLFLAMLCFAGCSATLPSVQQNVVSCSTDSGNPLTQSAPDDCRKEICVAGRLSSIEDLTETAPVSWWAEETFCFLHPIDCFRALSVKKHVRQWEQDMAKAGFWDRASLQSGLGDAARHAYLVCTLTERFGATFAKGLMDAHEEDSTVLFGFGTATAGNKCCDKVMDLYNNGIGIELAGRPGSCENKVLQSLGRLRYSLCVK